jgi:hypothetical protein
VRLQTEADLEAKSGWKLFSMERECERMQVSLDPESSTLWRLSHVNKSFEVNPN